MKKILLQTTIPYTKDDWSIARFSLLAEYLAGLTENGARLFQVTARDRDNAHGDDSVLSQLDNSDFDQLWLFGVDVGDGLGAGDCESIGRFRTRGGGVLTTRDHQDLGISFCTLGGVGAAHHFHSKNPPDEARCAIDDTESANITWPNYHSGRNGDYQQISVPGAIHPILRNDKNPSGHIERLPAHPHEGDISVPPGENARVIATGKSTLTGREFNLAVAFERNGTNGRAVADSSFHHFLDFNLDPSRGAPSFVSEKPGDTLVHDPQAQTDTHAYYRNLATWL